MSNDADGLVRIIERAFFLHTTPGKLVVATLIVVFATFYFGLCTWSPGRQNTCPNGVTLVGTLLDEKTKMALENVTVRLGTFAEDASLAGGQFTVEGIQLSESKIVPLTVEFSDGRRVLVKEFNLRNSMKYPVRDCAIDLLEILVKRDGADIGLPTPAPKSTGGTGQPPSADRTGTTSPLPIPTVPTSTTFFNNEPPSEIAILAASQDGGVSVSNLKNQLVQQFAGFSTTTTLFRPGFLSSFSKDLDGEDLAALKSAGLDKRTACLCFVRAGKVDFGKVVQDAGGESHELENATGSFEVKFFAFRSNTVRSFTIAGIGAGGANNKNRAREGLEESFMSQFSNQKLPLQLCKN